MNAGPPQITVTVYAPSSPDPRQFTWPKTKKIRDAASEAAQAFGHTGGNPTFQKDEDILDRNKPFAAEQVMDGDLLELVDIGGGV